MENPITRPTTDTPDPSDQADVTERPVYEAPRITVMDEADVLKTFQFTSAAISWWVM
jgi:hypothetical protein